MDRRNWIAVYDEISGREIIVDSKNWNDCGKDVDKYFLTFSDPAYLEAIRHRADVDEVIDFANKIRKAGGGNLIDELIPSTPEDTKSCLIANALNFHCKVEPNWNQYTGQNEWVMIIEDHDTGINIAETLDLEYFDTDNIVVITLPTRIGLVAEAFDTFCDAELEGYNEHRTKMVAPF